MAGNGENRAPILLTRQLDNLFWTSATTFLKPPGGVSKAGIVWVLEKEPVPPVSAPSVSKKFGGVLEDEMDPVNMKWGLGMKGSVHLC